MRAAAADALASGAWGMSTGLVYPPGSAHRPTVTQGRALVLYLLPEGRIDFTR